MTSLDSPSNRESRLRIDPQFLMRQFPALSEVKRARVNWNELGAKIIQGYQPIPPGTRRRTGDFSDAALTTGEIWRQAKELLHNIMATCDLENAPVRKRLSVLKTPSTAALFSTLSLYFAGKLGISLTITKPLLALMLNAVHEASGNWDILLD